MPHDIPILVAQPEPENYIKVESHSGQRSEPLLRDKWLRVVEQPRHMRSMTEKARGETGSVPLEAISPHIRTQYSEFQDETPITSPVASTFPLRDGYVRKERRRGPPRCLPRGSQKGPYRAKQSEEALSMTGEAGSETGSTLSEATLFESNTCTKHRALQDESSAEPQNEPPITLEIDEYRRPTPAQRQWAFDAISENGVNSQAVINRMFKSFQWHPSLLQHPK